MNSAVAFKLLEEKVVAAYSFVPVQVDLHSAGAGKPWMPLYPWESTTLHQDVQAILKACKRERQMLGGCQPGHVPREGKGIKNDKQRRREYLRSRDCLIANILEASLRRRIAERLSLRQILEASTRCQVLTDLPEPVEVFPKEKPDGGYRIIRNFGPIARGAQRMCAKLIEQTFNRQPFQFPGQGHVAKVAKAIQLITTGGYTHVAEIDIVKHYDSFEKAALSRCLPIPGAALEHIVFATSAMQVCPQDLTILNDDIAIIPPGLPQGGSASGVIADWSVSHLIVALGPDLVLINHADNFFLFAKSAQALDAGRNALSCAITQLPGGTFTSKVKAQGTCQNGFKMLGYMIEMHSENVAVYQDPARAVDFTNRFVHQMSLTTRTFNKSAATSNAALRRVAIIQLNVLRAMYAGWCDVQKITTPPIDPHGTEMFGQINQLKETFGVTNDELAKLSDPYERYCSFSFMSG